MLEIKKAVEALVRQHRSGALIINEIVTGGECSLDIHHPDGLRKFQREYLQGYSIGSFCESEKDFLLSSTNAAGFEPNNLRAWERLHEIFSVKPYPHLNMWETPNRAYRLKINSQNASHSINNSIAMLDAEHDGQRICRDQAISAREAREAGYGKSLYER